MKDILVLTHDSRLHKPPYEIFNGDHDTVQEVPARTSRIEAALSMAHYALQVTSETVPHAILEAIHDPDYIAFLAYYCAKIPEKSANGISNYKYPSVFPLHSVIEKPDNDLALHGYYTFDMYTLLMRRTMEVTLSSAALAYVAAKQITEGNFAVSYALCRPPGHHAERAQSGGYCYINNAAVAAEHLSSMGRVATLDVDFHHGNGTQHIFYERDDVMTVSIHAKPEWKFPYMSGFSHETGNGAGDGYNRNYPLAAGITNEEYDRVLLDALEKIRQYKPDFLVVSYGADTHESDPIGGFKLTTNYFTRMGSQIARLGLPTVIVQEGGYNTKALGDNVVHFLQGFENN